MVVVVVVVVVLLLVVLVLVLVLVVVVVVVVVIVVAASGGSILFPGAIPLAAGRGRRTFVKRTLCFFRFPSFVPPTPRIPRVTPRRYPWTFSLLPPLRRREMSKELQTAADEEIASVDMDTKTAIENNITIWRRSAFGF